MTVIAWDGKTLAADRRMSNSSGGHCSVTKIHRTPGGALIAGTGNIDVVNELRAWFEAGRDPEKFPQSAREDAATLVAIVDGEVWQFVAGPYPVRVEDAIAAWGSGRPFALTAMTLGKTAREAVEVACVLCTNCGNGIDTLVFE